VLCFDGHVPLAQRFEWQPVLVLAQAGRPRHRAGHFRRRRAGTARGRGVGLVVLTDTLRLRVQCDRPPGREIDRRRRQSPEVGNRDRVRSEVLVLPARRLALTFRCSRTATSSRQPVPCPSGGTCGAGFEVFGDLVSDASGSKKETDHYVEPTRYLLLPQSAG